jgi:hypothetical protein
MKTNAVLSEGIIYVYVSIKAKIFLQRYNKYIQNDLNRNMEPHKKTSHKWLILIKDAFA